MILGSSGPAGSACNELIDQFVVARVGRRDRVHDQPAAFDECGRRYGLRHDQSRWPSGVSPQRGWRGLDAGLGDYAAVADRLHQCGVVAVALVGVGDREIRQGLVELS